MKCFASILLLLIIAMSSHRSSRSRSNAAIAADINAALDDNNHGVDKNGERKLVKTKGNAQFDATTNNLCVASRQQDAAAALAELRDVLLNSTGLTKKVKAFANKQLMVVEEYLLNSSKCL